MLSWTTIAYGAALSAGLAALLVGALITPRRAAVIAVAGLAGAGGPVAWNAILRAVHAPNFFTDAPIAVFPASWQDTGSGVFALAVSTLALGLGPLGKAPGRRIALVALLVGVAAFVVDIYLY